jgi:GTP pyrophosphokinase
MPTVTRVLPWRRHIPPEREVRQLVEQYREFHPRQPIDLITNAHKASDEAHTGQLRRSGEPYITHPVAVAGIVARYGMDDITIAAALLHDAVEDTALTLEQVEARFGSEVASVVDGVTKLERLEFHSKEDQQAETMRKMLVAMAKDLRVLVIKLADRLHNMRTIAALPAWKQERTARETLAVYAPLAHRLGMQEVKQQLEDLCFSSLHPKWFAEIDYMVDERMSERLDLVDEVTEELQSRLKKMGIKAEVTGRHKHLWSIYEKMARKGYDFDAIFDLVGIRVVVGSVTDCYAALGTVHSLWAPVGGRFKDYVAMPKFNNYQSLHTTVIGRGHEIEVQVRTQEMHDRAEWGVAAHYTYKEGGSRDLDWLNRIVDWQGDLTDPGEFMKNLKLDLEQDEVFVFTPTGDVISLPAGATPVDFAYAIHTEVGHRCIGAKVGGKLVPLDYKLRVGDRVEIFTSKVENAHPNKDWLEFVATRSAATKIRQWFSRERREDALESGRDRVIRELRKAGMPTERLLDGEPFEEVVNQLQYADADALLRAVGEGHVSAASVVTRISQVVSSDDDRQDSDEPPSILSRKRRKEKAVGVHVEGYDDMLVSMARCCTPVPGDEIVGFITRGRGVSVHRGDCANAASLRVGQSERIVAVDWDDNSPGDFVALVEVRALDRPRLLQEVSGTLSEGHVNIIGVNTVSSGDRVAKMQFQFQMSDPSQLDLIINRLRAVDSVYDAYRVLPGTRPPEMVL